MSHVTCLICSPKLVAKFTQYFFLYVPIISADVRSLYFSDVFAFRNIFYNVGLFSHFVFVFIV